MHSGVIAPPENHQESVQKKNWRESKKIGGKTRGTKRRLHSEEGVQQGGKKCAGSKKRLVGEVSGIKMG